MTLCAFGDGMKATQTAYGQPVCRYHHRRCLAISNAECAEWRAKQLGLAVCKVAVPTVVRRAEICDIENVA